MLYREDSELKKWTTQVWLNQSERGSNKKIFQFCLDSDENILFLRAIQDHSGGTRVDLSLQDNVQIPHERIDYIYFVGSSISCSSVLLD